MRFRIPAILRMCRRKRKRIRGTLNRGWCNRLAIEAVEDRVLLSATALSEEPLNMPAMVDDSLLDVVVNVIDAELFEEARSGQREIALLAGPNGRHWQWLVNAAIINNNVQETLYVSEPDSAATVTVYVLESIFPLLSGPTPAATLVAVAAPVNANDLDSTPRESPATERTETDVSGVEGDSTTATADEDSNWPEPPVVTIPFEQPSDFPGPASIPTSPRTPVTQEGEQPGSSNQAVGGETHEPNRPTPATPTQDTEPTGSSHPTLPNDSLKPTVVAPSQDSPYTEPLEIMQFSNADAHSGTIDILSLAGGGIQLNFAPTSFDVDAPIVTKRDTLLVGGYTFGPMEATYPGPPSARELAGGKDRPGGGRSDTAPASLSPTTPESRSELALQKENQFEPVPKQDFRSVLDELFAGFIGPDRYLVTVGQQEVADSQMPVQPDAARSDWSQVDLPEIGGLKMAADVAVPSESVEEFPRESLAPERLVSVDEHEEPDVDGGAISIAEVMESELLANRFDVMSEEWTLASGRDSIGATTARTANGIAGELARAVAFAVVEIESPNEPAVAKEEAAAKSKEIAARAELGIGDFDTTTENVARESAMGQLGAPSVHNVNSLTTDFGQASQRRQRTSDANSPQLRRSTSDFHKQATDPTSLVNDHRRRHHVDVLPLLSVLALERFVAPTKSRCQKEESARELPQR